ncbi:sulfotransferase family 2 domain-containing protein [Shimia sp. SDUM112013]|uniref:sulfotransferase family 2 domain-containing protein n=1 Tax=Shimia sp. SDUM112013 TaxID=3136160 RepID=UPI0032EE9553
MPLFRVNDRIHYYAHVPKAGGSSVDHYLVARFGPLAFFNGQFTAVPENQRWTRTSPQHIRWRNLYQLFPRDWIESSFAVVRDPLARLKSAYHFQKEALKSIPEDRTFEDWFKLRLAGIKQNAFFDDNHLVPQTHIVPPDARVFRLEDGLDGVVDYLDAIEGAPNGPRTVKTHNARAKGSTGKRRDPADGLSPEFLALIEETYAEDYTRFGYPLRSSGADGSGAATSAPLPTEESVQ